MTIIRAFIVSIFLIPTFATASDLSTCADFDITREFEPVANISPRNSQQLATDTTVSLQLHDGLLKPQLDLLLREQFDIQAIEWRASTHHQWPTEFLLKGTSWRQLLQQMLEPYQLRVTLHANHTAIVDYQQPQRSAL